MLGTEIGKHQWDFPKAKTIIGRYVRLEPLTLSHLEELFPEAHSAPESFTYLRYGPFDKIDELQPILSDLSSRPDQPFWVVRCKNGAARGWLSICDVYQADGAFEIGSIWFSPALQGTREAREAIFLLMCLGMDDYEYERLVWRCQTQNEKSFQAAINLGFTHEGTWRNAAVVGGWQRDVAWFSILRDEWPDRRTAFVKWLSADNFDDNNQQIHRLKDFRPGG